VILVVLVVLVILIVLVMLGILAVLVVLVVWAILEIPLEANEHGKLVKKTWEDMLGGHVTSCGSKRPYEGRYEPTTCWN
jgi:hypothetical protein